MSGTAETARAAVGDGEVVDHIEIDEHDGHDHHLGDAIAGSALPAQPFQRRQRLARFIRITAARNYRFPYFRSLADRRRLRR